MRLPRWLAAAALAYAPARTAAAPNFTIPAAWTNTTLAITQAERAQLAQAGFAVMNVLFEPQKDQFTGGLPFYDTGRFLWTMALADSIGGRADYKAEVSNVLLSTQFDRCGIRINLGGAFDLVSSIAYYGIAAAQAYRTYDNSTLLNLAETLWANASAYQISLAQAVSGTHPTRNISFLETCNTGTRTVSVAGAVFSELRPDSLEVDQATSALLLLSAHLAEITRNATYTTTAALAAIFLSETMLDPTTSLIIDSAILGSVDTGGVGSQASECILGLPDTPLRPYATAMYIEGLAVLASVDADNASQWNDLMTSAVLAATQNTHWFGGQASAIPGVLNFPFGTGSSATDYTSRDDRSYNGRLVQGLYESYIRTGDSSLRAYLGAFLGTQLNALLAHAKLPGSNMYSASWAGPAPLAQAFVTDDLGGQISALCALTAALALPDTEPAVPSGSAAPAASASSVPTGVASTLPLALGLGLGITAAVLLALLFFWMLVRRRRRRANFATKSDEDMRAADGPLVNMPPETTNMPPSEDTLPLAPHVSAQALRPSRVPGAARVYGAGAAATVVPGDPRRAPAEQRPSGMSELQPEEKVAAGLSWAGQPPRRLLFGTGRDASSTLPAGGASPGEGWPAAAAIATEELLRELNARGVLPGAQEPLPVYEEINRRCR